MTAATAESLEREARPATPPNSCLRYTEPSRALFDLASFYAMRPMLSGLPSGDGHGVLVLPGFMASDYSTGPMRNLLTELGYDTNGVDGLFGRGTRGAIRGWQASEDLPSTGYLEGSCSP